MNMILDAIADIEYQVSKRLNGYKAEQRSRVRPLRNLCFRCVYAPLEFTNSNRKYRVIQIVHQKNNLNYQYRKFDQILV